MDDKRLDFTNECFVVAKIIAVAVIVVTSIVLIAWCFPLSPFAGTPFLWTSMKANTAICLFLSGLSLLLSSRKNINPTADTIITANSIVIILICSATVFEFSIGINLGIDQLFIKDALHPESPYPGRTALISAFNLIFVGLAFLFRKKISAWPTQILAFSIFFIGLLSFYNHLFGANINYAAANYTSMAPHTSQLFMLLGTGILLLRPDAGIVEMLLRNTTGGYYLRRLIPIIFFVPMLLTMIEKKIENAGLIQQNLGNAIIVTGIFLIFSFVAVILIRKLDNEEKQRVSAQIQIALNKEKERKYAKNREIILNIIETEKTMSEVAPQILRAVCELFGWPLGEIWLIDKSKNVLQCVHHWKIDNEKINTYQEKNRKHTFKIGKDLPGKIWKKRRPAWIPRYSKRRDFSTSLDAEKAGIRSAFGVPIIFQEDIFGVLDFFSDAIETPDEAMLSHLSNVGKLLGEFIHRTHTDEQIQFFSRYDSLTGLSSRSALESDLNNLILQAQSETLALIILDIDKFKLINEALGHDAGDLILKSFAKRLEELIDHKKSGIARLGADKFILYYKTGEKKEIIDYVRKIKETLKTPFIVDQKEIFLTVSTGISVYPQDGISGKNLIMNADLAMRQAKEQGGNKRVFFSKEFSGIALEKLSMDTDLRQAVKNNQFQIYYQPQIELATGKICGAEALVRWQHPERGLIMPTEFITYAEKAGLIVAINEHIARLIFQQIKSNDINFPIAINISAQQFKDKERLVNHFQSLIDEFKIAPKNIELEITESALMEDTPRAIEILDTLHGLGFNFSIDDFGTGFSSFNYVYRVPADKIKIDKSFIGGLPTNEANAKIVKSMIQMFHTLRKKVVAEGAETKAEVDFLKEENCDIVQGYYYSKPMPISEFIAFTTKK